MGKPERFEKLKARWEREKKAAIALSIERKKRVVDEWVPIFRKYGIRKALIFGSLANLRSIETSDIDIYVEPLEAESYWEFKRELEEAMELPVDLYTPSDDPLFVHKILQRGELIYEVQS